MESVHGVISTQSIFNWTVHEEEGHISPGVAQELDLEVELSCWQRVSGIVA